MTLNNFNLNHLQEILSDSVFDEDEYQTEEMNEDTNYPSQEKEKKRKVDDFFRCLICFGKVKDPLMCPHCSKFCCGRCFKRWLVEHKKVCPSCRHSLSVDTLIPVRFLNDLNEAVDNLVDSKADSNKDEEVCKHHKMPLHYFCKSCETPICSDCAMFSAKHKGHEFEHLKNIYKSNINLVQKKVGKFHNKIMLMLEGVKDVDFCINKLEEVKEAKVKNIDTLCKKLVGKLEEELKFKLSALKDKRKVLVKDYEECKGVLDKINSKMLSMNNVEIVKHSQGILLKLDVLNQKQVTEFKKDKTLFDFSVDKLLSFESSKFVLKPFSTFREQGDVIYSDPMVINGISWRLKVYPNGNAPVKGLCLSVFVEMYKGWSNWNGTYEYRVELVNRKDPNKMITREFISDFETSVSWGYNRFFKLDQLEREGFLDPEEDLIELKFYIRPSNECQLISDLRKYIEYLEICREESNEELSKFKMQLEGRNRLDREELEADYVTSSRHESTDVEFFKYEPEEGESDRIDMDEDDKESFQKSLDKEEDEMLSDVNSITLDDENNHPSLENNASN